MIKSDHFFDHEIKRLAGGQRTKFGGAKQAARTAFEYGFKGEKTSSRFLSDRFGNFGQPVLSRNNVAGAALRQFPPILSLNTKTGASLQKIGFF